jgi:MFS family permease
VPDLEIRPNSVSQTIDAVFKIYLQRFVPLVTIAAVVSAPIVLLQGIANLSLIDQLESADVDAITELSDVWDVIAPQNVAASLLLAVLGWVAAALTSGAVVVVVADAYLGRLTTWQDALQRAMGRLGPLLIGSLLFGLGVALGFIFFIIPGLILAVGWSVFGPAAVVEDIGGSQALGRAWSLTRGRRWPVLGAFLVMFIIVAILSSVIGAALSSDPEFTFFDVVVNVVINILTAPLMAATAGVLYLELRARHEPFDRLQLSSELHRPDQPPPLVG